MRWSPSDLQAAQEQLQKKNQELVDLYREKSKKLTQMTNLYNLLKARAMKSRMETAASENVSQTLNTFSSRTGPTVPPAQPGTSMPNIQKARTPKTPSFPFSPEGVEQLHRYQRSGTGSSKMSRLQPGGKSAMPPPAGHAVFNVRTGKSNPYRLWCLVLIHDLQPKLVRRISSTALGFRILIVPRRYCLNFPRVMRSWHGLEIDRHLLHKFFVPEKHDICAAFPRHGGLLITVTPSMNGSSDDVELE